MIFTQEKLIRNRIKTYIIRKMRIDIGEQILIQAAGFLEFHRMLGFIGRTIKVKHQVTHIIGDFGFFAISVLMDLPYQIEYLGLDRIKCYRVKMIDIVLVDTGLLHDITVCRRQSKQLIAIVSADPEYETLIVYICVADNRVVRHIRRYEHQITRAQFIGITRYDHGHIPVYKEIKFIIIVSMTARGLHMDITVVIYLEVLG